MKERLGVLLQANVITQQAHNGCLNAIAVIDKQLALCHNNEQYQMAMTHLARAADRIWQQEAVEEGLDPDVLEEIEADEQFPAVLALHQQLLQAMGLVTLPATEESFMLLNVYSLMQISNGD